MTMEWYKIGNSYLKAFIKVPMKQGNAYLMLMCKYILNGVFILNISLIRGENYWNITGLSDNV